MAGIRKKLMTQQYLLLANCMKHFLYNIGSFENEGVGLVILFKEAAN